MKTLKKLYINLYTLRYYSHRFLKQSYFFLVGTMAGSGDSRAYRKGHRSSQRRGKEIVKCNVWDDRNNKMRLLNKLFFMPIVRKREFIQFI